MEILQMIARTRKAIVHCSFLGHGNRRRELCRLAHAQVIVAVAGEKLVQLVVVHKIVKELHGNIERVGALLLIRLLQETHTRMMSSCTRTS